MGYDTPDFTARSTWEDTPRVDMIDIIRQDDICPSARGEGSNQMLDPEVFGGIDSRHLDRLHRSQTQLYRSVDHIIDMAFLKDLIRMFIVRAEHQMLGIGALPDNTLQDQVQIPFSAAFPDQYSHTQFQPAYGFLIIHTLVIICQSPTGISHQLLSNSSNCVTVTDLSQALGCFDF